jgi:DNA-binding response OmpR family regulator
MKVLVIDDDSGVRRYIQRVLEKHGMQGFVADGPEQARLELAGSHAPFDVILLDISMPGQSGWGFLEQMRAAGDDTPAIFLTAHHTVEERVRGLRMGADDYVLKPFEASELVARVEAVVRRRVSLPVLSVGELRVDLARRIVERSGERIEISPREFDVLGELVRAGGKILSKPELLRRVWGIDFDPGTKVVEVQVARLRRKLDRDAPSVIETVVGQGYRLATSGPS